MRVEIRFERCAGHARCEAIAPTIFATDEVEGRVVLLVDQISEAFEQTALRGAKSCPERAILIFGGDGERNQLWPPETQDAGA